MTTIRVLIHALLRGGLVALLIVAYDAVYDQVVPGTSGDADIGKGLLAFVMIICVCGTWGLVDGVFVAPLVWVAAWVLAGLGLSLGWELVISDGSLSDVELGSVVFIAQLLTVPALFGAGLTWLLAGRQRTASAQPQ